MDIRSFFLSFLFLFGLVIISFGQQVNKFSFHDPIHVCNKSEKVILFNDDTYDVNHYHLDLEIGIDQEYIEGRVIIQAKATENITIVNVDLDEAYTVTDISGASAFTFADNVLTITLDDEVLENEAFALEIFYEGIPPLAGGYKGLRYETHNGNEPIIASLSTPYLAHTWWPCNDGTLDKADSVFVDITIKDSLVSGIPLMAVSNGMLDQIVDLPDNKIQYQWKHRYPIVPYYVMVAISNYQVIEQMYDNGTENFPLEYYVFDNSVLSATEGVEELPEVMDFFTTLFGPYPFAEEKYSMTELGFYGGIENQTNTIINNMNTPNFETVIHELAHMWFADMITCSDWHHGWVNEGFATYATALYNEEADGEEAYHDYMESKEFYNEGTIYQSDVSNPFTVFQGIIYNKGAYALHMLRHVMGDEMFFESMFVYATNPEFKYKHATTEDFQSICEENSGLDLGVFFDQWIYDEFFPKYEYDFYQDEFYSTQLAIHQTQEDEGWRPVFEMPIDVEFLFTDGTDTLIVVENNEAFQLFEFSFDKEINTVTIDPNQWILKSVVEGNFDLSINSSRKVKNSILLYPNPTKDVLNVVFSDKELNLSSIRVFSANGNIVDEINLNALLGENYSYSTSNLAAGIYFLEIHFVDEIVYKKFAIE